ncbi:hypothetical protein ACI0FM_15675 [Paenochrobactrum sp. BZR 588]|uniref:hypothetical protein n=1 Tax=unclassified Paenochrobactrum TaxID=2639760 RepID=UPI003854734E
MFFNKKGEEIFKTSGYEINSNNGCTNIHFDHIEFGEQHIEIAPGGDEDARRLNYLLDNPESAIKEIEARIEMREEERLSA